MTTKTTPDDDWLSNQLEAMVGVGYLMNEIDQELDCEMQEAAVEAAKQVINAKITELLVDPIADDLVEKHYQLRIEHNHSTMHWYAYYAGKLCQKQLFDDDEDWLTESDTPSGALKKLAQLQASQPINVEGEI